MTTFRMKSDGRVLSEQQYRLEHVEIFPEVFYPEDADVVFESPTPSVDSTHYAVKDGVVMDEMGNWIWKWTILHKTEEQINVENSSRVPPFIAMWQARDIMIKYGFLDDVINFINNIQDPIERKRVQSKFEFSNTVRRDDPLLNYVATTAGYSKSQIDNWFIEANGT